ncbi:PREDICTED: uncharacterized protein LOC104815660 isoform X2 [Tarenaya hassleriana]|uniref:uncharacterized protein LOC104815660 isoform X2 n=1 Tax=Tarenaya hassleriana TaxID=28532 RepID=UPI00053C7486|nr:PREDICTED: uncharacterized protein LOC104815660 isoform X2 [Tarenaya hassleriana]
MAPVATLSLLLSLFLSLSPLSFSLNLRRPIPSLSDGRQVLSCSFTSLSFADLDRPSSSSSAAADIHDLLPSYGFPKGLLPDNVKSFAISNDGDFTVKLRSDCYVRFGDELAFYDKKISGKLSYGSVKDVEGIQAKKLFVWVPITAMESDPSSGTIAFTVGFLSEKLPAKLFEDVPTCMNKSAFEEESGLVQSASDSDAVDSILIRTGFDSEDNNGGTCCPNIAPIHNHKTCEQKQNRGNNAKPSIQCS